MIVSHFSETLLEVSIDNFRFKVTWNPIEKESCILWFQDVYVTKVFEALGKFSRFDRRTVLEFLTRFCTNIELRKSIEMKRFERKVESLTPEYFESVEKMSIAQKKKVYRELFRLDSVLAGSDIDKKRRMMVRKFHPDIGGDNLSMSIINDAYEYMSEMTG